MPNILNQILEIEEAAKKLTADAQAELDALPGELDVALQAKRVEYIMHARQKIENIKKIEEENFRSSFRIIDEGHAAKMRELSEESGRNFESWVELIFGECTGYLKR